LVEMEELQPLLARLREYAASADAPSTDAANTLLSKVKVRERARRAKCVQKHRALRRVPEVQTCGAFLAFC